MPLDYARPGGAVLHLALLRVPATGPRIGSLVVNPGGPGASGVQFAAAAAGLFPAGVRRRFDLVGFDPRGVGGSDPVRCANGAALDAFLAAPPAPVGTAGLRALEAADRAYVRSCVTGSGRLLAHVGTVDTARDLDVLRAALGEAGLTYYGASYGTYLGAEYARLFPHRVRALVLDGAVDPALGTLAMDVTQAAGFETDLRDFLAACQVSAGCPGGAHPQPALDALLARLTGGASLPAGGARRLTAGTAFLGLAAGLYSPDSWPSLRAALAAAEGGDGGPLLSFADQLVGRGPDGRYSNEVAAETAIDCRDRPVPRSMAAFAAAAARAARLAPHFGAADVWGSAVCAFWPVPAQQPPGPVHAPGAPPILVVGTTHDPATPYAWARALAGQLDAGHLLTFVGDGHTAYLRGDPCVAAAVDRYLIDRRLPAPGATCR